MARPARALRPVDVPTADEILSAGNHAFHASAEEVLQRLVGTGREDVRLALLDPPYNTKSTFHHYGDRQPSDVWLETRRRHMTMIRQLLHPLGSVWIHLDDSEHHYARVMLDEVFGRANYVSTLVWQKTLSRENRTAISSAHEYILVYAKDRKAWARSRNPLEPTPEQLAATRTPTQTLVVRGRPAIQPPRPARVGGPRSSTR